MVARGETGRARRQCSTLRVMSPAIRTAGWVVGPEVSREDVAGTRPLVVFEMGTIPMTSVGDLRVCEGCDGVVCGISAVFWAEIKAWPLL